MVKEYPYRASIKCENYNVNVYVWLLHLVDHTWQRYFLPGEEFSDNEYVRYEFVNQADAIVFKLKFG